MTFVDGGVEELAKFLAGESVIPADRGQYGDDGTTPTQSDTALGNPIASSRLAFSSISFSDLQVTFEHILDGSTSNGETLREFAILRNSDNLLFVRVVFTELSKTSSIGYTKRLTVRIRKVKT